MKKTTKKTAPPSPPEFVDSDGFLCVPARLLPHYLAAHAQHELAMRVLSDTQERLMALIQANPETAKAFADKQAAVVSLKGRQERYVSILNNIQAIVAVNLETCSIDDETGRIYDLTTGSAATPMLPEVKAAAKIGKQKKQHSKLKR